MIDMQTAIIPYLAASIPIIPRFPSSQPCYVDQAPRIEINTRPIWRDATGTRNGDLVKKIGSMGRRLQYSQFEFRDQRPEVRMCQE